MTRRSVQPRHSRGGHGGGRPRGIGGAPPVARGGFTLLELVLVMLVISTTMALAAPSLRNFWRAAEARDAGLQFLSVAKYAQTRAVADSVVYRLNIDTSGDGYWLTVQEGAEFVELPSDFGHKFVLPRDGRIEVLPVRSPYGGGLRDAPAKSYVDFHPDGRTDPALIRIDDGEHETFIECSSPAEQFRVLSDEEARRR